MKNILIIGGCTPLISDLTSCCPDLKIHVVEKSEQINEEKPLKIEVPKLIIDNPYAAFEEYKCGRTLRREKRRKNRK